MKAEIKCPDCGGRHFKMVNTVATSDIVVWCGQCNKRIGQFSSYGFTEEEDKKNDTHGRN